MATVSFSKKPASKPEASLEKVIDADYQMVPTSSKPLPSQLTFVNTNGNGGSNGDAEDNSGSGGQIEGSFGAGDIQFPYLTLCQKSGSLFDLLSDEHPDVLGSWVYNKEIVLGKQVRVIFYRMKKSFIEKREFGDSEIPARFDTMAEAKANGFMSNQIQDIAEFNILLEVDNQEGVPTDFIVGDKAYIPAKYTVRSSAYSKVVSPILRDYNYGWLKKDLASGFYLLGSEKKTHNNNTYFVPTLKADGAVSAELREEILGRLGL